MEELKYPARVNKYLAYKKICARREADGLILQKKVKINGRIAVLGDKVQKNDEVAVDNFKKDLVYLAFNKPKQIITHSPQNGEKEVKDILKFRQKVFPVGRLDKNSSGLILLTNDGRLTDRLLNPKYDHQKEYSVKTDKPADNLFLKKMSQGVVLDDGYKTKKCVVNRTGRENFSVVLTEGKKHQIRRMCDVLGYKVLDLKRTRIMNIQLNRLAPGEFREIKNKELADFLKNVGL